VGVVGVAVGVVVGVVVGVEAVTPPLPCSPQGAEESNSGRKAVDCVS
jgi:hypothetical protein